MNKKKKNRITFMGGEQDLADIGYTRDRTVFYERFQEGYINYETDYAIVFNLETHEVRKFNYADGEKADFTMLESLAIKKRFDELGWNGKGYKMLKQLGYTRNDSPFDERLFYEMFCKEIEGDRYTDYILFNKAMKTYEVFYRDVEKSERHEVKLIDVKLHRAIHQHMKDLGWFDEE